jgi:SWI/SNF-related matrix-associated actin-dependent regulator 1 of chromatin subfamily A
MNLMPYQVEGRDFLAAHKRALLADGMGLGKTAQAITAAEKVGAERIVVLCPAIARENWKREFAMWFKGNFNLVVESYDKVAVNAVVRKNIVSFAPDVLILDEAHYLKNRQSKRTKALFGPYCLGDGLVYHATRVWLLTGTPAPNNAAELFPMMRALWPDLISNGDKPMNYVTFVERYTQFMATDFGLKIMGNKNVAELKPKLKTFMLRRKAEDVLKDLPEIFWQHQVVEPVNILAELRTLEASLDDDAKALILQLAEKGGDPSVETHIATLRRLTEVSKATAVAKELAAELDDGAVEKIVVFGQHRAALDTIAEALKPFGAVLVTGATSPRERQDNIDAFQTNPKVRVFVGNITACNAAITLHAANHVAFLGMSWNVAENQQAAKRCHRIGQTRPVFVRVFSLAGSIDEAVTQVLERKTKMISQLIDEKE